MGVNRWNKGVFILGVLALGFVEFERRRYFVNKVFGGSVGFVCLFVLFGSFKVIKSKLFVFLMFLGSGSRR